MSSYPFLNFDPTLLINTATNVLTGSNPAYAHQDFLTDFPMFSMNVPKSLLDQFIGMANATVQQARWAENWRLGMGLFVAHYATLYLRATAGMTPGNIATPTQILSAAESRGLISAESVADVSVSYDTATISQDLPGWAQWKATEYGKLYATMARPLGRAPIYVQ